MIALAIKLTSQGPVFFRQERVGQYGKCFTMLKFRSMYVNNDSRVHKEFVTELITTSRRNRDPEKRGRCLQADQRQRITPVGKFLRRTAWMSFPSF